MVITISKITLSAELVSRFEDVKDRLIGRLRQTQIDAIILYPETRRCGLYLEKTGRFVSRIMMMGYPSPATAESWVFHYITDFSESFWTAYRRVEDIRKTRARELRSEHATREDPRWKEVPPVDEWDIIRQLPRDEIETALKEGIKIMEDVYKKFEDGGYHERS